MENTAYTAQAIAKVRRFLTETKTPPARLARMAGFGKEHLRRVFAPDWNPTTKTLLALERAIQEAGSPCEAA